MIEHSRAYRVRRFLNWFPLGLAYAFLYMGRYNLNVGKNALGELMTKEDFGVIFGVGTFVYGFAFVVNGPLTDRIGGRRAMLVSLLGAGLSNAILGWVVLQATSGSLTRLTTAFSIVYAANMYFQSFGAVAIVKVNSAWFHVRERGGFSGIFGTMISSGIFLAFTVNAWIIDLVRGGATARPVHTVAAFFGPAALLLLIFVVELFLLRDRPSEAGHEDFDTGAAQNLDDDTKITTGRLLWKILSNPIIITVAAIEFCTGILRQGVMQSYPFYAKEVLVLPDTHMLRNGSWGDVWILAVCFGVAAISFLVGRSASGKRKGWLYILGGLTFLAPFVQGGWGGLLFIAGVIGGNVAGWVSDLFFQSRRAPAAAGLYAILAVCVVGMYFTLGDTRTDVAWVRPDKTAEKLGLDQLRVGDRVVAVGDRRGFERWTDVAKAVACYPTECTRGSKWDPKGCKCTGAGGVDTKVPSDGTIPVTVLRGGGEVTLRLRDPATKVDEQTKQVSWRMRAGDQRVLGAGPVQRLSPFFLGALVVVMSLCVIGTHGLLSGTATMDFGGKRGTATAVGVIDGFVYLGTGVQSLALGYLTTKDWRYWPLFLLPFAFVGLFLLSRIWHAKPRSAGGH